MTGDETREQYDMRIRHAERTHEQRLSGRDTHNKQIDSFSIAAMKAPALVAAGGVAAALGFYSANFTRLSANPVNLAIFNEILAWLFASLLLTVIAPGLAYFSQIAYVSSINEETFDYNHPFTHTNAWSRFFAAIGGFFRWGCIVVVMASIACLIVGGIRFLQLVSGAN